MGTLTILTGVGCVGCARRACRRSGARTRRGVWHGGGLLCLWCGGLREPWRGEAGAPRAERFIFLLARQKSTSKKNWTAKRASVHDTWRMVFIHSARGGGGVITQHGNGSGREGGRDGGRDAERPEEGSPQASGDAHGVLASWPRPHPLQLIHWRCLLSSPFATRGSRPRRCVSCAQCSSDRSGRQVIRKLRPRSPPSRRRPRPRARRASPGWNSSDAQPSHTRRRRTGPPTAGPARAAPARCSRAAPSPAPRRRARA